MGNTYAIPYSICMTGWNSLECNFLFFFFPVKGTVSPDKIDLEYHTVFAWRGNSQECNFMFFVFSFKGTVSQD
jgi:hypothetical protein